MNGVVLLVGGLLLAAVIKLIVDRNWMGLLLCVVALKEMSGRLQKFQQQVKKLCCRMQNVRREARQAQDALLDLSDYLTDGIKDIRDIRSESGNDWKNYSESQKIIIGRTTQVAHLISVLSEVRFLTDEADLRGEIREALEATEELLDELGV